MINIRLKINFLTEFPLPTLDLIATSFFKIDYIPSIIHLHKSLGNKYFFQE